MDGFAGAQAFTEACWPEGEDGDEIFKLRVVSNETWKLSKCSVFGDEVEGF